MDKVKNVNIGVTDFAKLVQFAQDNEINIVVPGPEVPLVEGIESHFRKGALLSLKVNLQLESTVLDRLKRQRGWKGQKPFQKTLCCGTIYRLQNQKFLPHYSPLTLAELCLICGCRGLRRQRLIQGCHQSEWACRGEGSNHTYVQGGGQASVAGDYGGKDFWRCR
jgi:hypothetical protein